MAVIQISKIQVRRGQKNQGSGVPQLASGEIGYAVDTRELFIGSGSVSEGAPQVSNVKVLTEYDDIFTLVDTYGYRKDDSFIQTGTDSSNPTLRTLQDRLDDIVSIKAFGATGVETQDATPFIQRALDQLYLNTANQSNAASRVILHFPPGIYKVTGTVYIPPYATLSGAGKDKTIIKATTTAPVFKTQNGLQIGSSKTDANDDSGSSLTNQARYITVEGMTLQQSTVAGRGLVLQSCRDSVFRDLKITGPWTSGDTIPTGYDADIGLEMNSLSGTVESSKNLFKEVEITGYGYGVMSNWDIDYNSWTDCRFDTCGIGIAFGVDMTLGLASSGQSVGPAHNLIESSIFSNIDQHGIWILNGEYNKSENNRFSSVGNSGGAETQSTHSIIKYNKTGNTSSSDFFTRTKVLSYTDANLVNTPYKPEVEGPANWNWGYDHEKTISVGSSVRLLRLPQVVNQGFVIDYTLVSANYQVSRTGTITVSVNSYSNEVELLDDFYFTGDETKLDLIKFDAILSDEDGDTEDDTIAITYTSTMPSDDQSEFKFRVQNKQSDVG